MSYEEVKPYDITIMHFEECLVTIGDKHLMFVLGLHS